MILGTLQEAAQILGDDKPDADAMTRGQQKKIDEISKEVPASPAKKARMQKEGTMAATAKVGIISHVTYQVSREEPSSFTKRKAGSICHLSLLDFLLSHWIFNSLPHVSKCNTMYMYQFRSIISNPRWSPRAVGICQKSIPQIFYCSVYTLVFSSPGRMSRELLSYPRRRRRRWRRRRRARVQKL